MRRLYSEPTTLTVIIAAEFGGSVLPAVHGFVRDAIHSGTLQVLGERAPTPAPMRCSGRS